MHTIYHLLSIQPPPPVPGECSILSGTYFHASKHSRALMQLPSPHPMTICTDLHDGKTHWTQWTLSPAQEGYHSHNPCHCLYLWIATLLSLVLLCCCPKSSLLLLLPPTNKMMFIIITVENQCCSCRCLMPLPHAAPAGARAPIIEATGQAWMNCCLVVTCSC